MSGGGSGDPRDDETTAEEAVIVDYSYQNKSKALFRKARHSGSTFKRAILDEADLTEGDFTHCDFRRASMVGADLMKSAFDHADFRGADLRKARLNLSNFRHCKFKGADLRGIRGSMPSGRAATGGTPPWTTICDKPCKKNGRNRASDHSDSSGERGSTRTGSRAMRARKFSRGAPPWPSRAPSWRRKGTPMPRT